MADKNYKLKFTLSDSSTIETEAFTVPQGEQGEQGIQGTQGEQGEQGEQGIQGVQGISVVSASIIEVS